MNTKIKRPYKVAPPVEDWNPATYVVVQHLSSGKRHRVGGADSIADAEALIRKSDASLTDTLGGLFEPSPKGVYSIWKNTGWERVV